MSCRIILPDIYRMDDKMIFGYARVSTHEQNLESQIDKLKLYGCEKIIFEKVSSRSEDRQKLQELLSWIREGDKLVCVKMDRLARSVKELTTFIDDFQKKGVNLVFIDQDLDTSKPTGKLIFHMFAAFAEFERDIIRERTLAGLESARARGRKGGRKKAIPQEKIATAFKMYDSQNYTVREICDNLGIKIRTFYDYLKKRNQ